MGAASATMLHRGRQSEELAFQNKPATAEMGEGLQKCNLDSRLKDQDKFGDAMWSQDI